MSRTFDDPRKFPQNAQFSTRQNLSQETPHNDNIPYTQQFPPSKDFHSILMEWFDTVDQDHSGKIGASELKNALSAGGEQFAKGSAEQMISMFDLDGDKSIDRKEFINLFGYIQKARSVFETHAIKGAVAYDQIGQALQDLRLNIQPNYELLLQILVKFDRNHSFSLSDFDQFLHMALWLGEQKAKHQKLGSTVPFEAYIAKLLR